MIGLSRTPSLYNKNKSSTGNVNRVAAINNTNKMSLTLGGVTT
jgi:hypothetical protein